MRLLSTHTLQLEEFIGDTAPDYAILSHTWEKEEVIFPDLVGGDLDKARSKAGFAKVQGACALARRQDYDYIWIDTCCIDKSSSAELSEAINSMYRWYRNSAVCYAYLSDVHAGGIGTQFEKTQLERSRWFERGWTLQELIAPNDVEFYNADWGLIGEKKDPQLLPIISRASLVDECVLGLAVELQDVSVAKKMYWASRRRTTRKEDGAYCLMGLFDVNMPLLYGEGGKAFARLQQEIAKATADQSILAWYCSPYDRSQYWVGKKTLPSCFAPSPRCFRKSGSISPLREAPITRSILGHVNLMTNSTAFMAIIKEKTKGDSQIEVILHCQIGPIPGTFPTIILRQHLGNPRHYTRLLCDGLVTQSSLYTPESLLAHPGVNWAERQMKPLGFRDKEWGKGNPRETFQVILESVANEKVFEVEYVTIPLTLLHRGGFTSAPEEFMEMQGDGRTPRYYAPIHTFWLLPLAIEGSTMTLSIEEAAPLRRWNRGNCQMILNLDYCMPGTPDLREPVHIMAGVARISVQSAAKEAISGRHQRFGTAVVAFGLTPRGHLYSKPGWCALVNGDGVSNLEGFYASRQLDIQDPEPDSLLDLGNGVVLKASFVPTNVSDRLFGIVKLLVATQDSENKTVVDGRKHVIIKADADMNQTRKDGNGANSREMVGSLLHFLNP
ncbi:HET-domain-containing protein [Parathielavia appendiculata]|uniref:HET-domain-containing protein n=1 Tax=Parathielavia appendiculata TaxID=2587402 RepID=A0AAN6TT83_9PEZI|nr:HET-domain-containing protein [Parathielavia appendiculata]